MFHQTLHHITFVKFDSTCPSPEHNGSQELVVDVRSPENKVRSKYLGEAEGEEAVLALWASQAAPAGPVVPGQFSPHADTQVPGRQVCRVVLAEQAEHHLSPPLQTVWRPTSGSPASDAQSASRSSPCG